MDELKTKNSTLNTKDTEGVVARVVFDLRLEDRKIKVINRTFFEKASELGIRQGLVEVAGLSGDKLDEAVTRIHKITPLQRQAIATSSHKITKVNRTTQDKVAKQLRIGLEKGEGLNELTKRISKVMDASRGRTFSIARTQTSGAVSTGRHDGLKHAGTERHSWLDAQDVNVRDSHSTAASIYAKGIPIDLPFDVGGELLRYPGDPNGSQGNIINCRCMEIAIAARGRQMGLTYYDRVKFVTYEDMDSLKNKD